ncbi:hypothetical protein [Petrocella sp. FN5]|uniref:hypothetical protein n=1 Tax=Petrocella sp. FN5 TaxID=3032002 RepID=UPI0023DB3396|nr:hypothetical protein [Petrocella sp. FN5]MDF1618585.1 hypothetical protein [Petrocella sp. FN5]
MRKELTFVFSVCISILTILYLIYRISTTLEKAFYDTLNFSTINFIKIGVPLLGFIAIAMIIGVFAFNAKYISVWGNLISVVFSMYLILMYPILIIFRSYRPLYPSWMIFNELYLPTLVGGMFFAIIVVSSLRSKVIILELGDENKISNQ